MSRLKSKRILITCGTSGIGLEAARQFLAEGTRVAITGSNPATLAAANSEFGGEVLTIRADAGSTAEQKTVADTVREAFGGLDAVFVNAGIGEFRPLDQWDEASFDRSFAINLKGPFFLIQALLPILANPASIVLNASINAHIGMPQSSIYAASKAGLVSLARTLSGELISRGIRVNAVSPGPIATPLHGKLGLDEKGIAELGKQIPLGRRGAPDEIVQAVIFLASDEGAFAVGSEFIIDGDEHALTGGQPASVVRR